jgi:hypothetical protein
MRKVALTNVEIGILDANNIFTFAPIMRSPDIYLKGESEENPGVIHQFKVNNYQIIEQRNNLRVYFTDEIGKEYKVKSFAESYLQYLNRFDCNIVQLFVQCKSYKKYFMSKCKISNLEIVRKVNGQDIMTPFIDSLKTVARGIISGHRYLKNGPGKTSKIMSMCYPARILISRRTVYEIMSLSEEYENYLRDILSDVETILEYHHR